MSFDQPACPTCQGTLVLGGQGALPAWTCPSGHGLGLTLTAAYGTLQDDEIHALWAKARKAAAGPRACPMCERPMAAIDAGYDADEVEEGTEGDGDDTGSVPLDVCTVCELVWFDNGELEEFPADLENPEPTPDELAHLAQIQQAFGENLDAAIDERERNSLTERFGNRLFRHTWMKADAAREG